MRRAPAALVAALVLMACGGSQAAPRVDAVKALRDGAAAIAALRTVDATLKLTKGTITFQGFALVSAKTAVRLPADSDTLYTVKDQDISFELEVVFNANGVYVKLPFSAFQPSPRATFPDMAKLFDSTVGLPAVIPAGGNPKYVSTDQVGGVSAYQVTTTFTPAQVHSMLSALSSAGDVTARIWVDTGDHLIRKAVLDGVFGDGDKDAAVEVDLSGFNSAVVIATPSP
jgi:LppX_LprAFG lipoprotein